MSKPSFLSSNLHLIIFITIATYTNDVISDKVTNDERIAAIHGFGLQEKDGLIKQVTTEQLRSLLESEMHSMITTNTLVMDSKQCREICMADPECRSYSVCDKLGRQQVECLISRVSFDYDTFAQKVITPSSSVDEFVHISPHQSFEKPSGPSAQAATTTKITKTATKSGRRIGLTISVNELNVAMSIDDQLSPEKKRYEVKAVVEASDEEDNRDGSLDKTVNVTAFKDSACAIYNKVYLDYFIQIGKQDDDSPSEKSLVDVTVLPMKSPGACAGYCAHRNFRSHRLHFQRVSQRLAAIDQRPDIISGQACQFNNSLTMSDLHELINEQHCSRFSFIELTDLDRQSEEFKADLNDFTRRTIEDEKIYGDTSVVQYVPTGDDRGNKPTATSGYCVVHNVKSFARPSNEFALRNATVAQTLYKLNYLHFYDEIPGVSLVDSPKSNEVKLALANLAASSYVSSSDLARVHSFFDAGNNNQIRLESIGDIESCAISCFTQRDAPWPSCKSFDVVVENSRDGLDKRISCRLNSMTMAQARAFNEEELIKMIRVQVRGRAGTKHSHYEPRIGLGLERTFFASETAC